jgi:quinol monooxygenase YgiN
MIRVVAVLTAKPGCRDQVLAAFQANAPTVRGEKGCIEYVAHADAEGIGPVQTKFGPDTLVILETWESPEALAAHGVAPHMKDYGRKTKDLMQSRVIHVLAAA